MASGAGVELNHSALRFAVDLSGLGHLEFAMVDLDSCCDGVAKSSVRWNSLHGFVEH